MRTADARGLRCPLPLVMAKTALEEIAPGDELLVLATDPEASVDLAAWCSDEGHGCDERPAGGWREFVIRKG